MFILFNDIRKTTINVYSLISFSIKPLSDKSEHHLILINLNTYNEGSNSCLLEYKNREAWYDDCKKLRNFAGV